MPPPAPDMLLFDLDESTHGIDGDARFATMLSQQFAVATAVKQPDPCHVAASVSLAVLKAPSTD